MNRNLHEGNSFYSGWAGKKDSNPALIEENREFIEFLSYNEPFTIVSSCAASRVGLEISWKEFSETTGINELKLLHLCGILERAA